MRIYLGSYCGFAVPLPLGLGGINCRNTFTFTEQSCKLSPSAFYAPAGLSL